MRWSIIGLIVVSYFSCQHKEDTPTSSRPHEPFAFRSALDLKPRMLTLALHDQIWAAYSTATGSLYKVWKGTVHFDGSVYTYAHGPQPVSMGDAYFINTVNQPWTAEVAGVNVELKYQYRGHRIMNGHATLLHELNVGNELITIEETAEYIKKESGQLGFERIFTITNNPIEATIKHHSQIGSIIVEQHLESNGKLDIANVRPRKVNKAEVLDADITLTLHSNEPTRVAVMLTDQALIPNPNNPEEFSAEDDKTPLGARLISSHSCRTCHNTEKQTVGPSYRAVAQRYDDSDANVKMLVNKVKLGGGGVWGQAAMTPHPEVSEKDLDVMIRYVLSLDDPIKKESKNSTSVTKFAAIAVADSELIPGALVKVYHMPRQLSNVKDVAFGSLKPIMAGIMPNFDNMSTGNFTGLSEWFALTGVGYFYAEKDGFYHFRIWSDDGALLDFHDQLVINNDGAHGVEVGETKLYLNKGYHPFKLRYYQGGSGAFLSFNYRPDDTEKWSVVPIQLIMHKIEDHTDIANLSLPMSVTTRIPGNQLPLNGVHPSFDLSTARPAGFEPKVGGMDFLSDGRMVISTWDPDGSVYILDNIDSGDSTKITAKRIAYGLAEPLGLKVVDDQIYVMQKQEMTHLIDIDYDEIIDEYRTLANNWTTSANFHEFGFGLAYLDNHLYATLATAIEPGGASTQPQKSDRGKVIKVHLETGELSFVAHGLRTPNGIGLGLDNQLFVADNQGDWLPSSKILHIQEGAWYGSRSVDFEGTASLTEKLPVVWLPQDEIGNSPSTPIGIEVGPYKGQLIHGEVTNGGVKRVYVEKINGQLQGALFRFSQGIEGGVNRMVWGPDGALYVGCIGNPGNWSHAGTKWFGLQRLAYNSKSAFEMLAVRAKSNGIEIEFTEALAPGEGTNPKDYAVQQWYYKPTIEYGGPKLGEENLKISGVHISADRKKVSLQINGIKPNHVLYVNLGSGIISESGHPLWSSECWYTMNQIPDNRPVPAANTNYNDANNVLTDYEKEVGFKLLFDGKSLQEWHIYNKQGVSTGWKIDKESFYLDPSSKDGGDLSTNEEYDNFELKLDWKIQNCGNSGIMWNVVESEENNAPYLTGPEMQILDNVCHPDTRFETHRAGDLYDMIATKYLTVRPAGQWNQIRMIAKNGQMEFWQNGYKVVEFSMHTPEWDAMVAKSKFKDWPSFGKAKKGKIVLQDHGDRIHFRNVKIRKL